MNRYLLALILFALCIMLPSQTFAQQNEAFDPTLKRLNTLELVNKYIDSLILANGIPCDSKEEVMLINRVIENRFYHAYCHYSPKENLVAYLAGQYIWYDLSAIVQTEDILKYDYAACSQQSIVMMRVLKSRGFRIRKLGLVGHFVLEVFYDNAWHFYDPNKEPLIQGIEHDSLKHLVRNGTLAYSYSKNVDPEAVTKMFSQMEIGSTNEYPAKNVRVFHKVTKFLSDYFLVLFSTAGLVVFLLWKYIIKRRLLGKKRSIAVKQQVLV